VRDGTTGPSAAAEAEAEAAAPPASAGTEPGEAGGAAVARPGWDDSGPLHNAGSRWTWAVKGSVPEKPVSFTPVQFSPASFVIFRNLPGHIVVAVRRPAERAS
jgi:hypothetical protein